MDGDREVERQAESEGARGTEKRAFEEVSEIEIGRERVGKRKDGRERGCKGEEVEGGGKSKEERGKRKEERGKREEGRGKRKEERGKREERREG